VGEQTHESLRRYLLEETYELLEMQRAATLTNCAVSLRCSAAGAFPRAYRPGESCLAVLHDDVADALVQAW
jgi:hypothetical protein